MAAVALIVWYICIALLASYTLYLLWLIWKDR